MSRDDIVHSIIIGAILSLAALVVRDNPSMRGIHDAMPPMGRCAVDTVAMPAEIALKVSLDVARAFADTSPPKSDETAYRAKLGYYGQQKGEYRAYPR